MSAWADQTETAMLVDLYELTMLDAYWREGMTQEAVFSLFFRRLPERRSFALACGVDDVLAYLEELRVHSLHIEYLQSLELLSPEFLEHLATLRFTGSVRAMPEGTPVFPNEPLLEIRAPMLEAQLVETFVINQVHLQTVLASKAARVVLAARGRSVVDFGLRRIHGSDAGLKSARAFYIAGVDATSNVLAGMEYGIPVAGTMAHSYIQAHDSELDAFRAFARAFPETTLLVDTYDTLRGVDQVIALARELGEAFRVRAIRLDSGDLGGLARAARARLDAAGLERVHIFASGGLDEQHIDRLVRSGAPIDAFGVGTSMGVSDDAPTLDMAYKLVEYGGRPRMKTSPGKVSLPGPKQVFRQREGAIATGDVIALEGERLPGTELLVPMMADGRRLAAGRTSLVEARERARAGIAALPARLRGLERAEPLSVTASEELRRTQADIVARTRQETRPPPQAPPAVRP